MAIVSLDEIKQHVRVDFDDDNDLLTAKVASAQSFLERLLGFKIEETYGGEGQDPLPDSLRECTLELAAQWYANREPVSGDTPQLLPIGVYDIVAEFRNYSWADA